MKEIECEEDDCDREPRWVADGPDMVPTFLCDEHRRIYPDERLNPLSEEK